MFEPNLSKIPKAQPQRFARVPRAAPRPEKPLIISFYNSPRLLFLEAEKVFSGRFVLPNKLVEALGLRSVGRADNFVCFTPYKFFIIAAMA